MDLKACKLSMYIESALKLNIIYIKLKLTQFIVEQSN